MNVAIFCISSLPSSSFLTLKKLKAAYAKAKSDASNSKTVSVNKNSSYSQSEKLSNFTISKNNFISLTKNLYYYDISIFIIAKISKHHRPNATTLSLRCFALCKSKWLMSGAGINFQKQIINIT